MQEFGSINFWKVAMRPGRPMAFGHLRSGQDEALLFGLPGNPVAVMVTFYQFVQEALQLLGGQKRAEAIRVNAVLAEPIRKRAGRTEYQRGICRRLDNGQLEVRTTGSQGSGMLSSMTTANCFIILDHEQESLDTGATVPVQLFTGLI
jgi:molybdopterin molybdotransferase